MNRTRSLAAVLALGAAMLVPAAVSAGSPAGAWSSQELDIQDPAGCNSIGSANLCDRPGGMVGRNQRALLVTDDGGSVVYHRSVDAGEDWSLASELVPGKGTTLPAIAQRGSTVDVAYLQSSASKPVRYRSTVGFGEFWGPAKGFAEPRQVTTHIGVALGSGYHVVLAAGYDEAIQGRPTQAIRVRTEVEGIDPPVYTVTLAWNGGCGIRGVDPSIAVTGDGTIVLAYWKTCDQLVVRRSTNGGRTFRAAKTLSTREHSLGMSLAARGADLVLAYTADGNTYTRRSTDHGATWGAPVAVGSGARSLRVSHADGAWHLLAAGTTSIRYRSSVNGVNWSAGETVDSLASARTYALGVAHTDQLLAAYAMRVAPGQIGLFVADR